MKGEAQPLIKYFDGSDKRFIIPLYQRNYDWKEENCEQLFQDLMKLHNSDRKSHFFGSIVSSVQSGTEDRFIIDGQQRITTVSLLLIAMVNAQNRIRQLMAERGWTIYRLAQESGLSQTTISNIFKRNNQPSLPTVNAICDACGITLAQFFTENDTANSPNAKSELDNSVAALKEDQREALAAFIKTIV